MRVEVVAPYLDAGVRVVHEGAKCWAIDPLFAERPWCVLSIEYVDDFPPEGWFWLYNGIGNRKTILDMLKHGHLEINPDRRILSDGSYGQLARLIG